MATGGVSSVNGSDFGSGQCFVCCETERGSGAWPVSTPPSGRDGALSGRAGASRDLLALALALADDPTGPGLPGYVERDFRKYLECGILAHGFARAYCPECGHDCLVAFSPLCAAIPGACGGSCCPIPVLECRDPGGMLSRQRLKFLSLKEPGRYVDNHCTTGDRNHGSNKFGR